MSNSYNYSHRKLTDKQAEEIRHRYRTESLSHKKLSIEYGVSMSIIRGIVENRNYVKPNPLEKQVP